MLHDRPVTIISELGSPRKRANRAYGLASLV